MKFKIIIVIVLLFIYNQIESKEQMYIFRGIDLHLEESHCIVSIGLEYSLLVVKKDTNFFITNLFHFLKSEDIIKPQKDKNDKYTLLNCNDTLYFDPVKEELYFTYFMYINTFNIVDSSYNTIYLLDKDCDVKIMYKENKIRIQFYK